VIHCINWGSGSAPDWRAISRPLRNATSVDEHEIRVRCQSFDGATHREQPRMIDVQRVDFFDFGASHRPNDRILLDLFRKFGPH